MYTCVCLSFWCKNLPLQSLIEYVMLCMLCYFCRETANGFICLKTHVKRKFGVYFKPTCFLNIHVDLHIVIYKNLLKMDNKSGHFYITYHKKNCISLWLAAGDFSLIQVSLSSFAITSFFLFLACYKQKKSSS